MMRARQGSYRHNRGKSVAFEAPDEPDPHVRGAVTVYEQETGMAPQNDRLDLIWLSEHEEGKRMCRGPLANQGRHRTAIRRKEENRRTSPHLLPLVRSYVSLT